MRLTARPMDFEVLLPQMPNGVPLFSTEHNVWRSVTRIIPVLSFGVWAMRADSASIMLPWQDGSMSLTPPVLYIMQEHRLLMMLLPESQNPHFRRQTHSAWM